MDKRNNVMMKLSTCNVLCIKCLCMYILQLCEHIENELYIYIKFTFLALFIIFILTKVR